MKGINYPGFEWQDHNQDRLMMRRGMSKGGVAGGMAITVRAGMGPSVRGLDRSCPMGSNTRWCQLTIATAPKHRWSVSPFDHPLLSRCKLSFSTSPSSRRRPFLLPSPSPSSHRHVSQQSPFATPRSRLIVVQLLSLPMQNQRRWVSASVPSTPTASPPTPSPSSPIRQTESAAPSTRFESGIPPRIINMPEETQVEASTNASQDDKGDAPLSQLPPESFNPPDQPRLIYEGPKRGLMRGLKIFSLTTCFASLLASPAFVVYGNPHVPVVGRVAIAFTGRDSSHEFIRSRYSDRKKLKCYFRSI